MPVKIAPREHAKALIDRSIRGALARTSGKRRKAFLRLLAEVRGRSELLRPARFRARVEVAWLDAILVGLRNLNDHRKDWLRPLEEWNPEGTNPIPLFSSLAHHLLADYPVPPVLLSAWFLGDGWKGRQQENWFKRAGRGISLRRVGFPIPLTRRMAHEFARAPAHYPIDFALRWAQVRGLGGSDELARAVAATRLGREFGHDEFWVSALHFFINHPKIDLAQLEPIVEFLHHQRFQPRWVIIGEDTWVCLDAPLPDLSLKGWSVASLLGRVEEWKAQGQAKVKRVRVRWDRSAIGEFAEHDDQGRVWTIRELLDGDELAAEGKAMDHCVATYTAWCAKRLTTIWSVGIESVDGRERMATVEVNPASREIVQVKARSNEEPDASCLAIVMRWASQQSLTPEG